KRVMEIKAEHKTLSSELDHKLQLKRLGADEISDESQHLLKEVERQLSELDQTKKEEKKRITSLRKDKRALQARIAKTDAFVAASGGQLTEMEAKALILKKLLDCADQELHRYLDAERGRLSRAVENLWDKYALSNRDIQSERANTLKTLDGFLLSLGYVS